MMLVLGVKFTIKVSMHNSTLFKEKEKAVLTKNVCCTDPNGLQMSLLNLYPQCAPQ